MQVLAESPEDALAVLDALGPRGVWLTVGNTFESTAEAQAFLNSVSRRSQSKTS